MQKVCKDKDTKHTQFLFCSSPHVHQRSSQYLYQPVPTCQIVSLLLLWLHNIDQDVLWGGKQHSGWMGKNSDYLWKVPASSHTAAVPHVSTRGSQSVLPRLHHLLLINPSVPASAHYQLSDCFSRCYGYKTLSKMSVCETDGKQPCETMKDQMREIISHHDDSELLKCL